MPKDVPICRPDRDRPPGNPDGADLPRWVRLRRPGDFRTLFAQPTRSADACFAIRARHNGHRPARLGLAVSKKWARRAVDRNRIKRIVRESFRRYRHRLHGVDLVVVCRQHVVIQPNSRLFSSLAAHWKRVRELYPSPMGFAESEGPLSRPRAKRDEE